MKSRLLIAVALGVFLVAGLAWWVSARRSAAPLAPPSIRFVGFTNAAGTQDPVFARLNISFPGVLQNWLATGTNAARFTLTNPQNHTLLISAHGQFVIRGEKPWEQPWQEPAFLLQTKSFPEFFLGPHQAATIQVTFCPQPGPEKLRLFYRRDSREHSLAAELAKLPERLRARLSGRPIRVQRFAIESDWFDGLPAGQPSIGAAPPPAGARQRLQPVILSNSPAAGSRP